MIGGDWLKKQLQQLGKRWRPKKPAPLKTTDVAITTRKIRLPTGRIIDKGTLVTVVQASANNPSYVDIKVRGEKKGIIAVPRKNLKRAREA